MILINFLICAKIQYVYGFAKRIFWQKKAGKIKDFSRPGTQTKINYEKTIWAP